MKPVFANSAWVAAPERAVLRGGRFRRRMLAVRYGLFVHPRVGPVLIDTGYTEHALSAPDRSLALRSYARVLAPKLNATEQATPFLGRFGLTPADITRVIVTHFHVDHVAGLAAFPNARFIACGSAWAQVHTNTALQNLRHGVFAELIPRDFASRLDPVEHSAPEQIAHLPVGHDIFGDGSVVTVPLGGHAQGHLGVVFPHLQTPLLYATDTQWLLDALAAARRPYLFARLISDDYQAIARSCDHAVAFRTAGGAVMLCHDDALSPFDHAQGATL